MRSSGGEEEFLLKPLARKCTCIYWCDLLAQDRVDKSLLTSEEALPLVICKFETAAIREEQLCNTDSRNLFKGRWIWCGVLMKNVFCFCQVPEKLFLINCSSLEASKKYHGLPFISL